MNIIRSLIWLMRLEGVFPRAVLAIQPHGPPEGFYLHQIARVAFIGVVTELSPRPILGRLNRHLLKIAVAHLLRNSIEATQPQGKIRVSTSIEGDYAVLEIEDTGRGMPSEVVDKVFMPFYTTKIGGTGLGMVFVRQIVGEHRGDISLKSEMGVGTTVTIKLALRFAEAKEMTKE